ncbi:hypothetical protein IAG44_28790 [Streptomyces roseirectus]|uniref:DUF8094 domain-containing protein n=1 Tax=Streptomyces roseirectus TaxID=2768066 RepID=A0A7H0IJR6_9ACTN|nr:hypothetical protein [Streptomyces roseirectus]QNP73032.1 hypothetical protein IAG44_28790 [Streptomyces roseirectus]
MIRLRRRDRNALIAVVLTGVSLSASGCVVIHGEREVVPTTTPAEAAEAVREFTAAYNKADKAYDSSLDAAYTTGPLGVIDAARLKAGRITDPGGNPNHQPLALSDVKVTIPKKAGWPRWFVADSQANRGGSSRWLMVFTRNDVAEPWQAAYLTLVAPDALPAFKRDADGYAEAVSLDAPELSVSPGRLSASYAEYLGTGQGLFADGAYTSVLRSAREKATRPGLATQYIDEPLNDSDYRPVALRAADGGAVVFFSGHNYTKQTAAAGTAVPAPNASVKALTTGEVKQSLTMEFVSNVVAVDPMKGVGDGKVKLLSRVEGLTGAKGE